MIKKIRAIVLQQIKYSDSGVILKTFTREKGCMSVLVRGTGRKKTGKQCAFLQPLFILDMEVYYKEDGNVQLSKELTPYYIPVGIRENVQKTCMALFLGEVISAFVREPNEALYDYMENAILYFDKKPQPFINFHISFLAGMCGFLGFEPAKRENDKCLFFNMVSGQFVMDPPLHEEYVEENLSLYLASFFSCSFYEAEQIRLNGRIRNDLLNALIKYIAVHIPVQKKINSLEVLREIFS